MKIYSIDEAAALLRVSPRSLADKRYRLHWNIPARKVGRRLVFAETDCLRLLEQGKEVLSTTPSAATGVMGSKRQGKSC